MLPQFWGLGSQMLEREASREKNLEKAAKDAKSRARRAADVMSKTQRARTDASGDPAAEKLAQAEAEFYAMSGIAPPPKEAPQPTPAMVEEGDEDEEEDEDEEDKGAAPELASEKNEGAAP